MLGREFAQKPSRLLRVICIRDSPRTFRLRIPAFEEPDDRGPESF